MKVDHCDVMKENHSLQIMISGNNWILFLVLTSPLNDSEVVSASEWKVSCARWWASQDINDALFGETGFCCPKISSWLLCAWKKVLWPCVKVLRELFKTVFLCLELNCSIVVSVLFGRKVFYRWKRQKFTVCSYLNAKS